MAPDLGLRVEVMGLEPTTSTLRTLSAPDRQGFRSQWASSHSRAAGGHADVRICRGRHCCHLVILSSRSGAPAVAPNGIYEGAGLVKGCASARVLRVGWGMQFRS